MTAREDVHGAMTSLGLCLLLLAAASAPLFGAEPLPPAGFEAIFDGEDQSGSKWCPEEVAR